MNTKSGPAHVEIHMHQDTLKKPRCRFCGSTDLTKVIDPVLHAGVAYRLFFCSYCKIGLTWPHPELVTLAKLYAPGEYRGEEGKRFIAPVEILFELHKKWLTARLSKKIQPGKMLDIGCGSGLLASLFARAGWNVAGVELNDETAVHARETYGIKVFTDVYSITEQFDLILINHVLEHYVDPGFLLKKCLSLLKPNGKLVVAVPNFSSLQSRLGRKYWFHLDLPIHLYHFTENGLVNLLVRSGYTVVQRSHADWVQNFYGWLQTLLNMIGLQHNVLYDLLRMKRPSMGWPVAAITISVFSCFWAFPLSLMGMFVEKIFRTGGVIRCTAVKNHESYRSREYNLNSEQVYDQKNKAA